VRTTHRSMTHVIANDMTDIHINAAMNVKGYRDSYLAPRSQSGQVSHMRHFHGNTNTSYIFVSMPFFAGGSSSIPVSSADVVTNDTVGWIEKPRTRL